MGAILKITGILPELMRKVYKQDKTTEKVKPTWSGAWFRQLMLIL
jgi:Txe/YoeB family toxin of Txe-Axe toxin-antitoxin module